MSRGETSFARAGWTGLGWTASLARSFNEFEFPLAFVVRCRRYAQMRWEETWPSDERMEHSLLLDRCPCQRQSDELIGYSPCMIHEREDMWSTALKTPVRQAWGEGITGEGQIHIQAVTLISSLCRFSIAS